MNGMECNMVSATLECVKCFESLAHNVEIEGDFVCNEDDWFVVA